MARVIYDVIVRLPDQEERVIRCDEPDLDRHTTASTLAEKYLSRLEAALEKLQTGPVGTFRIGGEIVAVTPTLIPSLEVRISQIILSAAEQAQAAQEEAERREVSTTLRLGPGSGVSEEAVRKLDKARAGRTLALEDILAPVTVAPHYQTVVWESPESPKAMIFTREGDRWAKGE